MDPNRGNLIYDPNRLVLTIEDRALLWSLGRHGRVAH